MKLPQPHGLRIWFGRRAGIARVAAAQTLPLQPRPPGCLYWCTGCQKPFSVRIGTALERSTVPLRKWIWAIYLEMTNLKCVSSMKLHRDIKATQTTAWFMLHHIREAWAGNAKELFEGPVEVDETYFGGKRKNMPKSKREKMTACGAVGKSAVVVAKDREKIQVAAKVVQSTDAPTLQGFVEGVTKETAKRSTLTMPKPTWALTGTMSRSITR